MQILTIAGNVGKVVARRKRDRDELAEEEAMLEMYETAIGGGA